MRDWRESIMLQVRSVITPAGVNVDAIEPKVERMRFETDALKITTQGLIAKWIEDDTNVQNRMEGLEEDIAKVLAAVKGINDNIKGWEDKMEKQRQRQEEEKGTREEAPTKTKTKTKAEGETEEDKDGDKTIRPKKVDVRNAKDYWPENFLAEKGGKTFAEFTGEMENYLAMLAPDLEAERFLEWVAKFGDEEIEPDDLRDQVGTIVSERMARGECEDIDEYDAIKVEIDYWMLISKAMGPVLHKVCKKFAASKIKPIPKSDGINTWRMLSKWFSARSDTDSATLLTMILNPNRAANVDDLQSKLDAWDEHVRNYETKFNKADLTDAVRRTAMRAIAPEKVVEQRIIGVKGLNTYDKLRNVLDDYVLDRRDHMTQGCGKEGFQLDAMRAQGNEPEPKRPRKTIEELTEALAEMTESLNSLTTGKGNHDQKGGKGGKGDGGKGGKGQWQGGKGGWSSKGGGKGRGDDAKAAGKGGRGGAQQQQQQGQKGGKGPTRTLICHTCGGQGHPARLCPSQGWLNNLEGGGCDHHDHDDTGVNTGEFDDELVEFSLEWDVGEERHGGAAPARRWERGGNRFAPLGEEQRGEVKKVKVRKQTRAEQTVYAPENFDLSSAGDVNSLELEEAEDEIALCQLSDEAKEKMGWYKVSAVADSGSEAHAIPEHIADWLGITPSAASLANKSFRGAGGESIPAKGKRTTVGRTAEGQTRKIIWEVCPVRRPLLSLTRLAAQGNVVRIGPEKATIANVKTGEIARLHRERGVWMLDLWVKGPTSNTSDFPRQGQ